MTPDRVEPCLPSRRKISPSSSLGYNPAVRCPSAPATAKDVVIDVRDFGSRRRIGDAGCTTGTDAGAALPSDRG